MIEGYILSVASDDLFELSACHLCIHVCVEELCVYRYRSSVSRRSDGKGGIAGTGARLVYRGFITAVRESVTLESFVQALYRRTHRLSCGLFLSDLCIYLIDSEVEHGRKLESAFGRVLFNEFGADAAVSVHIVESRGKFALDRKFETFFAEILFIFAVAHG